MKHCTIQHTHALSCLYPAAAHQTLHNTALTRTLLSVSHCCTPNNAQYSTHTHCPVCIPLLHAKHCTTQHSHALSCLYPTATHQTLHNTAFTRTVLSVSHCCTPNIAQYSTHTHCPVCIPMLHTKHCTIQHSHALSCLYPTAAHQTLHNTALTLTVVSVSRCCKPQV
jgi:hypothetical protein